MLVVECKGTPYEIGFQHGQAAKTQIGGSIAFYRGLFLKYSNKHWPEVRELAQEFEQTIREKWPWFYEEMQGIAAGSELDVLDIIAVNVRTEIAFGLFTDGCTSLYWKTEKRALLGQNWDWMEEQKDNLVIMTIHQEGKPTIKMVNEAGMLGKIGFNSSGVGVVFNAIRAKGVDPSRMPVHLGLRTVLESQSAKDAIGTLERVGLASSAHMLIADASFANGCEFSSKTFIKLPMDSRGRVIHANHLLAEHPGVDEPYWLEDSPLRVQRMQALTDEIPVEPSFAEFSQFFTDETHFPVAICRAQEGGSTAATLFNIVMDLKRKEAIVIRGRPVHPDETISLSFA